ncbi:MAG: LacI family transcriptional regulator [Butyricicoccus sp.]|nr:LacI family transcriptional regulator [Butyricicoccus sp.]
MTIKDIARLSGCGVATVSRVLNDHPDVSEETRQKVLAVVEEQGFQPNNNAKHLKKQTGGSIAIIVKGTMNMLFADLVERVQALLLEAKQDAAVYYLDEDANEVAYALQLSRERRPRGIIFLGGDPDSFRESFAPITVPCVLLTNTARELGFQNLSSFSTDDSRAAEEVIKMLAAQGHRHIGLLGGSDSNSPSQVSFRRLTGSQNACRRLGLPFDARLQYESCRYALPDAYAATEKLLKRCPDMTAVFAISDVTAMGAIRALRDMGKRVPEDISVVGYDGIVTGQYFLPRLTTIRQDTQQLAERGVETLLWGIFFNGRPVHELIPFQLVQGESVARLA